MLTIQEITKIYEENADKIYRYFYFHVYNKEIAQDLTSTLFHKFIKNLEKYDETKAQPLTWLFTIARNVLVDYFRSSDAKRRKNEIYIGKQDDNDITDVIPDGNKSMEENVQIDRNKRLLMKEIAKLKQEEQDLIYCRYFEEMAYEEIARKMNIKVNDVGVKLHRTLEKLKKLIKDPEIKKNYDLN